MEPAPVPRITASRAERVNREFRFQPPSSAGILLTIAPTYRDEPAADRRIRHLALSSIDTGDKHPGSATFRIVDASACELLPPELPPGLLETLLNRSLGDEGFIG